MSQPFRRQPIAAPTADENDRPALKRVLGAGDLVMLAAAQCCADLAAMIPQAGGAHAAGTLAVAISCGDGFDTLTRAAGVGLAACPIVSV